jgi:hypothetical protein
MTGANAMYVLKWCGFTVLAFLLSACGGGGSESTVVYKEDEAVLVVDGRAYHRRAPAEIGVVFLPEGNAAPGLLNVRTKAGVEQDAVIEYLQRYGFLHHSYYLNCYLELNKSWCWIGQLVVPPDWGDQWRRAMADWPWVESVDFERADSEG